MYSQVETPVGRGKEVFSHINHVKMRFIAHETPPTIQNHHEIAPNIQNPPNTQSTDENNNNDEVPDSMIGDPTPEPARSIEKVLKTRSGRAVNQPQRLNYS